MNPAFAGILALVVAAFWPLLLGTLSLLEVAPPERWVRCGTAAHAGLLTAAALLNAFWYSRSGAPVHLDLPRWFDLEGYRFDGALLIDPLTVVYALLTATIYGVVTRFSFQYLHREPGFHRFFLLTSILALGLTIICYAGNFDILFVGWEMVGLTSVLLISFFRTNSRSVQNSLRALVYYRLCDMAMLAASVWIHPSLHTNDFIGFQHLETGTPTFIVGLLIILSTLAKSAQFPMSSWLHRAMEGPTSSSAIFYGALSVHLGPFLLLRTAPLWEKHLALQILVGAIGVISGAYGTLVGRTRADAKTALANATLAQIGVIYLELGLGLYRLALWHLAAHAGLRTWQFLRSSSLLQDFQENPVVSGDIRLGSSASPESFLPERFRKSLYIHSLNGFYLEAIQRQFVLVPLLQFFSLMSRLEDSIQRFSSQRPARDGK